MEILCKIVLLGWMAVAFVFPGGPQRAAAGVAEWKIDGFDGLAIPLTLGEDTVYGPGYSASAFARVEIGMSREQVHALLGRPLRTTVREDESAIDWQAFDTWTYSPGDTHYRVRQVFYLQNRVVEKQGYLYFD